MEDFTETGTDFKKLVTQGQEIIERLCGDSGAWTNYNTSDPGVTILEHLSYAITDLSYRLSFPVQDLLEEEPKNKASNKKKILFSAKEALTVHPLTINDYRKILIDVPEVKNAQIKLDKQQKVEGIYQILIAIRKRDEQRSDEIITKVKQKLHQYRNLCEDFLDIQVLESQGITIEISIEIQDNINIKSLKEDLYKTVAQLISPEISFTSLEELKAQGKTIDKIFDGPILEHGFIDDEALEQFDARKEVDVADIIEAIYKIKKVKAVRDFTMCVAGSNQKVEYVNIVNKAIYIAAFKLALYKNGYVIQKELIEAPEYVLPQGKNTDLLLPLGRYRDLAGYRSVQEDFAPNYLLGKNNEPETAVSQERKISSKQLKAYLLIFDQILANYFAQANGIKVLFNYIDDLEEKPETTTSTYFYQSANSSSIEMLVSDNYIQELKRISEEPEDPLVNIRSIRKNILLDFLLAMFGETFKDYSVSSKQTDNGQLSAEQELINKKVTYLTNFPKLSGTRGKAINYTLKQSDLNSEEDTLYPLQECISNILGLTKDEFYLIEHILLRPFTEESKPFFNDSINLYSYQISIIFSSEKVSKTFGSDLMDKIREVIRNEVPLHLATYCHLLDDEQMNTFAEYYRDWVVGFDNSRVSDTTLINSRIITKILYGIKGIGSMVIGAKSVPSQNYYHFTVYDGQKAPLISHAISQ